MVQGNADSMSDPTSPVRVGPLTSFARQSPAKLQRSGLRASGIRPHQHGVMVRRLNGVRPRSRFRLRSAAVHKADLGLTPRLSKASAISLYSGRKTWTTTIRVRLIQARGRLGVPLVVR